MREPETDPHLWEPDPFAGRVAALATMHGKERAVAPALADALGLRVVRASVDTDRLGTFTREIPRAGTAREAARRKAELGLDAVPEAAIGLASEGSFGPHPRLPFVAGGVELVVLVDRARGLELAGTDVTTETNFAHARVDSVERALAFAAEHGFPSHAMIVLGLTDGRPDPARGLHKGLTTPGALEAAVREVIAQGGSAHVESDMRAHLNPTRMRAIARAAADLARRARLACPACARPGFDVVERRPGLPCEDCGGPTLLPFAEIVACAGCGRREERPISTAPSAPAQHCPLCNP